MFQHFKLHWVALGLIPIWAILFLLQPNPFSLLKDYGAFSLLGVIGAIFANSTGAGGGVVFVPFFNQLGFSSDTIIGTSLGIQCCGMTAGALTWWRYYLTENRTSTEWQALPSVLLVTVPVSILGMTTVQFASDKSEFLSEVAQRTDTLHVGFGLFSVLLSLAIFASIPLMRRVTQSQALQTKDKVSLIVIGYVGGMITAWLSVGVGELVAVYLIIRGFNVTMSIAIAVMLTAFTVWSGIHYHAFVIASVNWAIVLFAGAGAIAGGMVAKYVVLAFSPSKLKLFFGTWVLLLGLATLPIG